MGLSPDKLAELIQQAPADKHKLIVAKVEECLDILRAKAPGNKTLYMPDIDYDLTGTTSAHANAQHISINIALLNRNWDDFLNKTIPHEVAHVAQYQIWAPPQYHVKAHGRQWVYLMNCLGLPAIRCHNYEVQKTKNYQRVEYHCNCRTFELTLVRHNRILKGHTYHCTHCGAVLQKGPLN